MLTNFDLLSIAEENGFDLVGIYSKDQLPKDRVVGCYIINLQDYNAGSGSHWCAFKIFDNGKACYMDAFGFPSPVEVNSFLSPFKPIAYNNREIQHIKSDKCGYFCLAFIKYFNNFNTKKYDVYEAFDDFLNAFSNNTKVNDDIVLQMLDKY